MMMFREYTILTQTEAYFINNYVRKSVNEFVMTSLQSHLHPPKKNPNRAEGDGPIIGWGRGFKPNLISNGVIFADSLSAFFGYSLSDTNRGQPSGLCAYDVALGTLVPLDEGIKNELRNLGGLS